MPFVISIISFLWASAVSFALVTLHLSGFFFKIILPFPGKPCYYIPVLRYARLRLCSP